MLLSRCTALFRTRVLDKDLEDELRSHIEFAVTEKMESGLAEREARREALKELGGVTQVSEGYRAQRGLPFFAVLAQDLRSALRQLRKAPGFSWTAILTLALGIGTTAAMFSVIDAGGSAAAAVQGCGAHRAGEDAVGVELLAMVVVAGVSGYAAAEHEFRRACRVCRLLGNDTTYWRSRSVHERLQGSDNFFNAFGVKPLLGRTYLAGEDQPGRNNVLVLGYEVWRQQFHGDGSVIGKTVDLDGSPYVVIGVMPAGFRLPFSKPNLIYIPMHVRPPWVHSYGDHWLQTVGLLKRGVSLQTAQAEMAHVMLEIGEQHPESDKGRTAQVMPISAAAHEENELPEIAVMFAAVLAALLIACANVTGLQLARAACSCSG